MRIVPNLLFLMVMHRRRGSVHHVIFHDVTLDRASVHKPGTLIAQTDTYWTEALLFYQTIAGSFNMQDFLTHG